jgi:alpha-methylacyl-CoA racemase
MTSPLDGIRVLDLTRLLPGAVCTLMLVDLGAQVIKIEDPHGGDYLRWFQPAIDGQSAHFRAVNRGKRSVIINLKAAGGPELLKRLAQNADVLVEGFRPGVMARLGCDYAALRAANPRLVYCSLSGWGADGPYAQRSGHDINYVALAGLPGAMETPQVPGGQMADIGVAYIAVAGILAALLRRERAGEGGYVDTSLAEAALPFGLYGWVEGLLTGTTGGQGALTGGRACYRVYITRDAHSVALGALEPKFWANFCHAIDRPDLIDDYLLPERQPALIATLQAVFATRTAAEWQALLGEADCCFSVVRLPGEIGDDPHFQARAALGTFPDGTPWMRSPVRLSDDDPPLKNDVPAYGQHTRQVLQEAGYSQAEIDALAERAVIQHNDG